jgi:adenosylcobinamide-GDP ribazoletransferase
VRRQGILLLRAIQILTRLPVPWLKDHDPDALARSAKFFPLVGEIVGAVSAVVWLAAGAVWGGALPALLAIGAGILVTGALHEDGLADTADALGGGRNREHRLAIMKDSRIGTYGVLALVLCLGVKIAALAAISIPMVGALALLAAHGGGRAASVAVMATTAYAGDPEAAKFRHAAARVKPWEAVIAHALGAWPLLLLPPREALAGALLGGLAALWVARRARALVGGYTGDVLGAVEQAFETGFLLGASAALLHA